MGKLIRLDTGSRTNSGQVRPKGESEVLIFTGVRYERSSDSTPSTAAPKTSGQPNRRKRKRS